MSLAELGMVMVIISLALAPVVKMLGGPTTEQGNAVQVIGQKSKEILLANTLIEKALAADYTYTFGCESTNTQFKPADPKAGFPTAGKWANLPASPCESKNYNQSLYYQWTVRNMDQTTGTGLPDKNHYYTAVLNVWSDPSQPPLLSLPASFYWSEGGITNEVGKTGIAVILDTSGSMCWGKTDNTPACYNGLASPYLKYRFADTGYNPSPSSINMGNIRNNQNLDIVSLKATNEPDTEWDDRYLGSNIHGAGACDTAANNDALWTNSLWSLSNNTGKAHVRALCKLTGRNGAGWGGILDSNFSRIEAARSSLLSFLTSIEANPDLYQNVKLGFITFGSNVTNQVVPLESADSQNQFFAMRRKFTWLNRSGPGLISATTNTNMYDALQRGADVLYNDSTLTSRIIFFVGDGEPTVGKTDMKSLAALSKSIGEGTYAGAKGKKITVFSLGLLSQKINKSTGNRYLDDYLKTSMSDLTPGGTYNFAQTIGEMAPIFEQISYQIQRMVLLNKGSRYNLDFSSAG
ncbi:MAG TPA: vWA domain-containing protein [Oculatellaceae cyanobacterium]